MSAATVTTNHDERQRWVEERGGRPARVKGTAEGKSSGVLVIDYPGYSGDETLESISWEEFFEGFEENNLAFLYQDETSGGKESRFSKLVSRETTEEKKAARSGRSH